jgi:hypothetical protein
MDRFQVGNLSELAGLPRTEAMAKPESFVKTLKVEAV